MIDILVGDNPTGFDIAAALAIDGVPDRRVAQRTAAQGLVVVGYEFDAAASPSGSQAPVVSLGGIWGAQALAARMFDEPIGRPVSGPLTSPLAQRVGQCVTVRLPEPPFHDLRIREAS